MLQTPGIYMIENGVELKIKCRWKGASQFAVISNLHKIVDSTGVFGNSKARVIIFRRT